MGAGDDAQRTEHLEVYGPEFVRNLTDDQLAYELRYARTGWWVDDVRQEAERRAGQNELAQTDRSRLRRKRERGHFDRALVESILDESLVGHVGFVVDGATFVQPMTYARVGEVLYLHGAAGNRMLRHLSSGADLCVTVTILDGLVFARSAFHHSMNYRSVMLFGTGRRVTDETEMLVAVAALLDHMATGRSADARPPTDAELRATLMIGFPIDHGAAKVRTGGPIDDPEDLELAVWGGHVPVRSELGRPVADPNGVRVPLPTYLERQAGHTEEQV